MQQPPGFQEDDLGRCPLRFSKVLEDQAFTIHSRDLDCAAHFGFFFHLSLSLSWLLLPRITTQINYLNPRPCPYSDFRRTQTKKFNIEILCM